MKAKIWIIIWSVFIVLAFGTSIVSVYYVDPFFHYHKPHTDKYFYPLNNERSQNDGIVKHFDYNALVTGTSMTENFRSSEVDSVFGVNSIKVPFGGASYKEINDNIEAALRHNPNLRTVIRILDIGKVVEKRDAMRFDLGYYPTYLYDSSLINDAQYVFNIDVLLRSYSILVKSMKKDSIPGITDFDVYSRWHDSYSFGINTVSSSGLKRTETEQVVLTDEDREIIRDNIVFNVIETAKNHPDVTFYYCFSPYSAAWWNDVKNRSQLLRTVQALQYATELILPYKNVHLFSFDNEFAITSDLNNYKDATHYGSWVNSLMVKWMHEDKDRLTEENCIKHFSMLFEYYENLDYESINKQPDYEADYCAGAVLNEELTGAKVIDILQSDFLNVSIRNAEKTSSGTVDCYGLDGVASYDYYSGVRFSTGSSSGYNYLCFNGRLKNGTGELVVMLLDENNNMISEKKCTVYADSQVHDYAIDVYNKNKELSVVVSWQSSDNGVLQLSNIRLY